MAEITIETTLEDILANDADVAGLVGTRIYPAPIPIDADLPAIAYQNIGDRGEVAHDGPTGTRQARIQVTATAATYKNAKILANFIEAALNGYQAAATGSTVEIESMIIENKNDGYNQTSKSQTVRLDVLAVYLES